MPTLLALLACLPAGTPADEVVARVLAERDKIRSWHVSGTYQTVDRQYKPGNTAFRFELWRDGDKARTDRRPLAAELNPGLAPYARDVTCLGCWPTDGRVVWARFPDGAVEYQPPGRPPSRVHAELAGLDIRKFGLIPDSIFGHPARAIDTWLRKVPLAVAGPVAGGGPVSLAGTHPEHGYTVRLTVDPSRGHCVTAIDADGVTPKTDPPSRWRHRARITPAREPASGLWYVRESRFESWQDDKPARELTVVLDAVELNRPIDPGVFSLGGLGIPVGYLVSAAGEPQARYWDGHKVGDSPPADAEVVYTPPPAPPPEPAGPAAGGSGWVAPALTVAFAVGAVLLLRRAVRRRSM